MADNEVKTPSLNDFKLGLIPVVVGEYSDAMYLRQHAATAEQDGVEVDLTSTFGLGGVSVIAGIKLPDGRSAQIVYDFRPVLQAITEHAVEIAKAAEEGRKAR